MPGCGEQLTGRSDPCHLSPVDNSSSSAGTKEGRIRHIMVPHSTISLPQDAYMGWVPAGIKYTTNVGQLTFCRTCSERANHLQGTNKKTAGHSYSQMAIDAAYQWRIVIGAGNRRGGVSRLTWKVTASPMSGPPMGGESKEG